MTISSELRRAGPYTGDGVATSFPFYFKVFSAADVLVIGTDTAGADSDLVLAGGYTVSLNADQDSTPGGVVICTPARAIGTKLTILSRMAEFQPTLVTNGGGFYPRVFNDVFDRLTILIQQQSERLGRAIIAPASDDAPALKLPTLAQRKGKFVAFDASGDLVGATPEGDAGGLRSDLAQPTGTELLGFQQTGAGAVVRVLLDKTRERVSLEDFGGTGNGTDANTVAATKAIAALPASGGVIEIGEGTFRIGNVQIPAGKAVEFVGRSKENATVILAESPTANVFSVQPGADGSTFRKLHFKSLLPRTAGSYIDINNANRILIDEFRMDGAFLGISAGLCVKLDISRGFIWQTVASSVTPFSAGIQLGKNGYTGSVGLRDLLLSNQQDPDEYADDYQPQYGIDLLHCDRITMQNVGTVYQGTGLSIRPGIGQFVTYVDVDSASQFDTSRQGLVIAPTGGLIADGGGFVGHMSFAGQCNVHNILAGIVVDSAVGEVSDLTFSSGGKALNNYAATVGVLLKGANTDGVTFTDWYFGNNGTVGLYAMACKNLYVRVCDFGKRGFTPKQATSVLINNGVTGRLDLCSSNDTFTFSNLSPGFLVNGVAGTP